MRFNPNFVDFSQKLRQHWRRYDNASITPTPITIPTTKKIVQISAGEYNTVAIDEDGIAYGSFLLFMLFHSFFCFLIL
jgi:alpha-tubulin suppressor-like RCC1 family protein